MKVDLFTSTGTLSGQVDLPADLFEAPVNRGLMHLALVRQQSNRRNPIAHAKHRGEMVGSTKKMFQQKHTGNARRGPRRSPLLKGGGKSFGPRNEANFYKAMPQKMRRAALLSCLSQRAKDGAILALQDYPADVKTKSFASMLKKMPVELGRKIVLVIPGKHRGVELSARNIPNVKTLMAQYLNPEDILGARHLVFMVEALKVAEKIFGEKKQRNQKSQTNQTMDVAIPTKKPAAKKTTTKRKETTSSSPKA